MLALHIIPGVHSQQLSVDLHTSMCTAAVLHLYADQIGPCAYMAQWAVFVIYTIKEL